MQDKLGEQHASTLLVRKLLKVLLLVSIHMLSHFSFASRLTETHNHK